MEYDESGSMGTINDDEFTEFDHDATEPPVREAIVTEEEEKKKRGRPKIPEKWTRVLAIESDPLRRIVLPTIASELQIADAAFDQLNQVSDGSW